MQYKKQSRELLLPLLGRLCCLELFGSTELKQAVSMVVNYLKVNWLNLPSLRDSSAPCVIYGMPFQLWWQGQPALQQTCE